MQGHWGNIKKCPCIARFVLSGHTVSHLCSPFNLKCTFEPWWHSSSPLLVAILPLLRQFNPPHSKKISVDLQCQHPSTQKCHHCSCFFRILYFVTDTWEHEILKSDHFDWLSFMEYCLCHSYTATHDLWQYHRSVCDRFWLIGTCILIWSMHFSFWILIMWCCVIFSSPQSQARWKNLTPLPPPNNKGAFKGKRVRSRSLSRV